MGLRKERWGERFIGFSKSFILIFFLKKNIVLMWKIVGASKVSVLYIYIDKVKIK